MVSKKDKVLELSESVHSCMLCEELVKSRSQSVMGYGDFNADVFIIGEAPGRLGADQTGVPFTKDRSGVFLQKLLGKIKLNFSEPENIKPKLKNVHITNIVRCNPQTPEGTNRSPSKNEISNCMNYLEKELDTIKPSLVVTLGMPSAKVILGNDFSSKNFGRIIKTEKFDVLPLWHPAYVIRGGGSQRMNEQKYFKYFKKIQKYISK